VSGRLNSILGYAPEERKRFFLKKEAKTFCSLPLHACGEAPTQAEFF
jgi:hypothetical protein